MSADGVQVTALPGGLSVASDAMAVETAALGVWLGVGTRDEPAEVNGVAHVLEHMAFKGTRRRTARDIAVEIEAVGGHLNAYTAREHTGYHARVLASDVDLALDILADILQHSVFDEAELERERGVILQEIGQAEDTPDDIVFDRFQETAYPGQALGRPVLGRAETVRRLPKAALGEYMRRHYSTDRMVLAAAGRVDHERLVERARALFVELPPRAPDLPEPARYRGGEYRARRELEQVNLVLGFEGVPFKDPDYYAAILLSTVLGGGMSSRLFQEIRERRGLVYSIYSFASPFRDGGLFGIYAGTGEAEAAELLPLLAEETKKLLVGVEAAEMARARAQLKAGILMGRESTEGRCEQLAQQLLIYGRPLPVAELVGRIDAVDAEAVQRVLRRVLGSRPTLAVLGPIDRVEPFDRLAARFA